jgi:membrane protease YdiL (CAAX protease family)
VIDEQKQYGTGAQPGVGAREAERARRVPPPEAPGHDGRATPGQEAPGHVASTRRPVPAPTLPGAGAAGAEPWPSGSEPGAAAAPSAAPLPSGPAGPPPTRAATPGQPFYLPQASWGWPAAVAGLALGSAPEVLLTIAAALGGGETPSRAEVTVSSAALLAVGALVVYGWQGLAAWLCSLRGAGRSLALWGFRRPGRAFFWTIPLALVAVYAVTVVHDLVVDPEQQEIISAFPRSGAGIVLFVLVAVVMAPLFEEVVFRGFLFRGFANSWGWVWGAVVSSAIFGIAHLQLDVFVPLAALGFALAWVYRRTGSLWTCIAMHAIFNAVAVLAWALTG